MPGFNQKGPMGEGAMTGRRMGRCTNFGANQPKKIVNPEPQTEENTEEKLSENNSGRGMGFGRGMGMGRGMGFGRGKGGKGQGMGRQNRFRGDN